MSDKEVLGNDDLKIDGFAESIGLIKHIRPSIGSNSYVVYSTPPTDIGNYVDIEPLHLMMLRPLINAHAEKVAIQARISELWNPNLRTNENEKVIRDRVDELHSQLTNNQKEIE